MFQELLNRLSPAKYPSGSGQSAERREFTLNGAFFTTRHAPCALLHVILPALTVLTLLLSGCSTSRPAVSLEEMEHSSIDAHELVAMLPDYWDSLQTITGTGRAIVSEPGNSDRVTLQFQSSREASLIEVRTSVGIEGGQILVDADSLLIYNRVDKYAEKVSVYQSNLTSVGSIASLNMLDLFNFTFSEEEVDRIFEDQRYYMAILSDSSRVTISKEDGWIVEVVQMSGLHDAAYSKIEYEGYSQIENFYLPRRITIFSSDGNSRATFLVQQLEVNRSLPPLRIDLPDDIPIYRPG